MASSASWPAMRERNSASLRWAVSRPSRGSRSRLSSRLRAAMVAAVWRSVRAIVSILLSSRDQADRTARLRYWAASALRLTHDGPRAAVIHLPILAAEATEEFAGDIGLLNHGSGPRHAVLNQLVDMLLGGLAAVVAAPPFQSDVNLHGSPPRYGAGTGRYRSPGTRHRTDNPTRRSTRDCSRRNGSD